MIQISPNAEQKILEIIKQEENPNSRLRMFVEGGGRNECLREVELLMNAFNIKYRRIDSLVYG